MICRSMPRNMLTFAVAARTFVPAALAASLPVLGLLVSILRG